jgi:hypothetical protein
MHSHVCATCAHIHPPKKKRQIGSRELLYNKKQVELNYVIIYIVRFFQLKHEYWSQYLTYMTYVCDYENANITSVQYWIWGSHSSDYEECYLLGYNSVQSGSISSLTFASIFRSKSKPSWWELPPASCWLLWPQPWKCLNFYCYTPEDLISVQFSDNHYTWKTAYRERHCDWEYMTVCW